MATEVKDIFIEYKLEYVFLSKPDTLVHNRLTSILKFVRNNNLNKYTISGLKNNVWQVLIKF